MTFVKKRILFTLPNFKTAGSKYVLLAIVKRLEKEQYESYVVVERFPEEFPKEIRVKNRLYLPRGKSKVGYIRKLKSLLQRKEIDLVHSWDYRSTSLEAIACRWAGVPYLYTKKNNAWSKRWFAKSVLSKHIAYNNPDMLERFFNHTLWRNKVSFIPHGLDTEVFRPISAERASNTFVIGCIGVISPNKNQLFLLRTLKELPGDVHLNLYGKEDEEYKNDLLRYIRDHRLEDRVNFEGYIENANIPEAMAAMDVLVLPSLQEGLPLCILEAMACGVPVLSSDSGGGARYLLSDGGGKLFSLDSIDTLKGYIMQWKDDIQKRKSIGEKGRWKVITHFTIEKEVTSYQHLYQKLLT